MSAEPSIQKALQNAEGLEPGNGTALSVEARSRHIVLNRFVIVRQIGPEPALE